ncbi:Sec-independent protein translocase protein TatB [Gammaproteobacteria bacterium]
MFEVGFWELVMVGVVALLVVGPERLPGLARSAGLWMGKARYFISSVKAEINREIKAEELRRIVEEQARIPELHDFIDETHHNFTKTHDALRASFESPAENAVATPLTDTLSGSESSTSASIAAPPLAPGLDPNESA